MGVSSHRHRVPLVRPALPALSARNAIKGIVLLSFRTGSAGPVWLRPGVARHSIECLLVALSAVQVARVVWAAVLPLGPIGHPAPPAPSTPAGPDAGVLARFDPFHRGPSGAVAAAPVEAADGLRLFGVRASGGGGSAIIAGPDGRQAAFAIGDAVAPGTTLQAVAADHVVLASGGRRSSLFFPRPLPGAAGAGPISPPPPPPQQQPLQTQPPAGLPFQNSLQPRMENGRINGFAVLPGGPGAEMMREAGIQPGDVLLSVNGSALTAPDKAAELGSQLASAGSAVVQYERGGQVNSVTLKMARP